STVDSPRHSSIGSSAPSNRLSGRPETTGSPVYPLVCPPAEEAQACWSRCSGVMGLEPAVISASGQLYHLLVVPVGLPGAWDTLAQVRLGLLRAYYWTAPSSRLADRARRRPVDAEWSSSRQLLSSAPQNPHVPDPRRGGQAVSVALVANAQRLEQSCQEVGEPENAANWADRRLVAGWTNESTADLVTGTHAQHRLLGHIMAPLESSQPMKTEEEYSSTVKASFTPSEPVEMSREFGKDEMERGELTEMELHREAKGGEAEQREALEDLEPREEMEEDVDELEEMREERKARQQAAVKATGDPIEITLAQLMRLEAYAACIL
ncbi:unnamed protein product, partial [Protopolystoma xenopodis]